MSFFGNLGKKVVEKASDLAAKVDNGRDYVAAAANNINALVKGKDSRAYLKPGNVIQLLSRSSGRTMQIIVAKDTNQLICDAIGGTGSYYPNAHWLVANAPNGHFYFHNNYNYLAIKNGRIVIIPSTANDRPPNEAEFRVHIVLGSAQAVHIESVHMSGYFLNFDDEGQPFEELKLKGKERPSQFEISLVAYGPGIQPEKDDQPIEQSNEPPPPSYWAATSNTESLSNSHKQ